MLVDFGLYFAQKIARNDYYYWVHVPNTPLAIFFAFWSRFGFKLAVDFTGMIQF